MAIASAGISMRTGTRWTTVVKLPVALSAGRSEKTDPVAGAADATRPSNSRPGSASKVRRAGEPGTTPSICVSLKLAST